MKRRVTALAALLMVLCLSLAGCGDKTESTTEDNNYSEEKQTTEQDIASMETNSDALYINDGTIAGNYLIYEIGGMSLEEYAGLLGSSLKETAQLIEVELSEDNSASFGAYGAWADVDFTRNGDEVVFEGDGVTLDGTLRDGLLTLDINGTDVVLARLTDRAYEGATQTAYSEEISTEETALAESDTVAPSGVASGDGYVSGEKLLKAYVWLSQVVTNTFDLTYEEIADYFGVDGQFEKEEYSDHMKRNYRYYKWISEDDELDYIYFNFEEGDDGTYTLSAYNTNHFSGTDAVAKYLDEVKAEAADADRAAASNMEMKTITREIYEWAETTNPVTVTMDIPASGWSYNESKEWLVDNEDPSAFGAGFIQFTVERDLAALDRNKDNFENYKEIGDREIGGITFQGRTYKRIGYEWEEYIAEMSDGRGFSIGIVKLDTSDGTVASRILDSISFK